MDLDRRRRFRAPGVWLVGALLLMVLSACDPAPIPDPGRTAGALGGPPGQVALTFDDGPDPTWTPQVLDILDQYGVKATFFVLGWRVAEYPGLAAAIVARGHSIANHTWNHPTLTRVSQQALVDELTGTSNIIRDATGYIASCARPPSGTTNARVNNTIAELNMRPALWSVDTKDWTRPGTGAIIRSALSVHSDGVVLMHDGGGDRSQTVAALPVIIAGLQARGDFLTRVCDSHPAPG